jgi:type I restriction enzyme S subunit
VGRYPIVDQGASFIAGYTDDKSKLYSGCLPVIVFGDHTRIFKFADFSFSLGADGIKLIQPKDFLNPKYFYYYLCSLTIESEGYNRHYKYLKEKIIAFPEKTEQQKIAFVLSKIQQAIEQQDKIIETTRELKKSLMYKLFTEGLNGEEQKETESGLMPKSWDSISVQDCLRSSYRGNSKD